MQDNGSHPDDNCKDTPSPVPEVNPEIQTPPSQKQKSHQAAYPIKDPNILDIKKMEYISRLSTDEYFRDMSTKEKGKELGVHHTTVVRWNEKMRNDGTFTKIAEIWANAYIEHKPTIDLAMIREAERGNVAAAQLCYQKMEGWSVRQGMDLTVNKQYEGMDNKALMKEMLKGLSQEETKQLLDGKVEEAKVETAEITWPPAVGE